MGQQQAGSDAHARDKPDRDPCPRLDLFPRGSATRGMSSACPAVRANVGLADGRKVISGRGRLVSRREGFYDSERTHHGLPSSGYIVPPSLAKDGARRVS